MTPKGTKLDGLYPDTFWGHTQSFRNRRDFFSCAVSFVETLADRKNFIHRVNSEKGKTSLFIDVLGNSKIGDVLRPEQLEIFSQLGIELGVELFP